MSFTLNTPILDMSSNEYHSLKGTWSSSQIKTILEDEELFFKSYIEKSVEKGHIAAFDVGTYFHTGVLEPHKLKKECAVYPGKVRKGAAWEKFQRIHKGKSLLTAPQAEQGEALIRLAKNSPVLMNYVKKGTPEVSMFITLAVVTYDGVIGQIFAPHQELRLTPSGWVRNKEKIPKNAVELTVKVRADSIDLTNYSFVLDLKSMSDNAKNERDCRQSVSNYSYDLSAAFYLDVFSAGLEHTVGAFRWGFASKGCHNCKTWKASEKNILVGRSKWATGIIRLAYGIQQDWEFSDEEGTLEPNTYEVDNWINRPTLAESLAAPNKKLKAKLKTVAKSEYSDLL